MRNFEERKAEVFRRSENRIKERRRSVKRMLVFCIPLCLIVTVLSVTMLYGTLPAEKDSVSETGKQIGNKDGVVIEDQGNRTDIEGVNDGMDGSVITDIPTSLSFSLTWNTNCISS